MRQQQVRQMYRQIPEYPYSGRFPQEKLYTVPVSRHVARIDWSNKEVVTLIVFYCFLATVLLSGLAISLSLYWK